MKTAEATVILKSLGWAISNDEVGDKVANFRLADRDVQIIYGIRRSIDHQDFRSTLSTSTEAFSEACRAITGDKNRYSPLVRARNGIRMQAPEILEQHVRQAADEAISWSQVQDLQEGLRELSALPTTALGARPIWHLAALSVRGDLPKISSYQAAFEAGDRLDFVPYITKDHIDRAMIFAQSRVSST